MEQKSCEDCSWSDCNTLAAALIFETTAVLFFLRPFPLLAGAGVGIFLVTVMLADHWNRFWNWMLWPSIGSFFAWIGLMIVIIAMLHYGTPLGCSVSSTDLLTATSNHLTMAAMAVGVLFPLVILIIEGRISNSARLVPAHEIYLLGAYAYPTALIVCVVAIYAGRFGETKLAFYLPILSMGLVMFMLFRILLLVFHGPTEKKLRKSILLRELEVAKESQKKEQALQKEPLTLREKLSFSDSRENSKKIPVPAESSGKIEKVDDERLKQINTKIYQFWKEYKLDDNLPEGDWVKREVAQNQTVDIGNLLVTAYIPHGLDDSRADRIRKDLEKAITINPNALPNQQPWLLERLETLIRQSFKTDFVVNLDEIAEPIMILLEADKVTENQGYQSNSFRERYTDHRALIFDYLRLAHFHLLDREKMDLAGALPLFELHYKVTALLAYHRPNRPGLHAMAAIFKTQAYFLLSQSAHSIVGTDPVLRQLGRIKGFILGLYSRIQGDEVHVSQEKAAYFKECVFPNIVQALESFGFYTLKFQRREPLLALLEFLDYRKFQENDKLFEAMVGLAQICLQLAEKQPEHDFYKEPFQKILESLSRDIETSFFPLMLQDRWDRDRWLNWEDHDSHEAYTPNYPTYVDLVMALALANNPPWGFSEQVDKLIQEQPERIKYICDPQSAIPKLLADPPEIFKQVHNWGQHNINSAKAWLKQCLEKANEAYKNSLYSVNISGAIATLDQKILKEHQEKAKESFLAKINQIYCSTPQAKQISLEWLVDKEWFVPSEIEDKASLAPLITMQMVKRNKSEFFYNIRQESQTMGEAQTMAHILGKVDQRQWNHSLVLITELYPLQKLQEFFKDQPCGQDQQSTICHCTTPLGKQVDIYYIPKKGEQVEALVIDKNSTTITWGWPNGEFPKLEWEEITVENTPKVRLRMYYSFRLDFAEQRPMRFDLLTKDGPA